MPHQIFNFSASVVACSRRRPVSDTKRRTKKTLISYTSPRYCRSILLPDSGSILLTQFVAFIRFTANSQQSFTVELRCDFFHFTPVQVPCNEHTL